MTQAHDILLFWFGDLEQDPLAYKSKSSIWFKKSDENDQLIQQQFEADLIKATKGELNSWCDTDHGWLAFIILLDQFSRNIYRDTPQSFAQDEQVRQTVKMGLNAGKDTSLLPVERAFAYMPLMHSEHLSDHELCIQVFEKLIQDSGPDDVERAKNFLQYELKHWDIIEKYGRYPHRNKILGRKSTPEEIEFLKTPGSRF